MEEQLTLEQLAIYLPYELKVALATDADEDELPEVFDIDDFRFKKGQVWELAALLPAKDLYVTVGDGELNDIIMKYEGGTWWSPSIKGGGIKPILRPLSDLTKEIEVNGEKFVPVLEIGKKCGYDNLEKYDVDGDWEYGWTQRDYDDGQGFSFGWWPEGKCFGVWYDYIDSEEQPIYQLGGFDLIQNLASWHFDIHGLIGKGLAIDINTL